VGASVERSPNRANQSGIVTFTIPGLEPAAIRERALANQIVLSCRGGGVRASVHAYNNSEDIERLIATLGALRSASSRTR
jgi:cysteine desulfurase / selenocysteine lyase